MSRFRVIVGGIAVGFAALVVAAPAASADPVDDAISSLRSSSLYVASDAQGKVGDRGAVQTALGSSVKVAVFPSSVSTSSAGPRIQNSLSGRVTLAIFSGTTGRANSSVYCRGFAQTQLDKAIADNRSQLRTDNDLTNTLVEFANNLQGGPVCANGSGTGSTDGAAGGGSDSGTAVWPWLVGLGVVGAGGVGGFMFYRKRKLKRQLETAKANVVPYYDRLANEVNTLDPGDNATARQAVADASERFTSAGSQLSTADSVEKYAAARRTTLEGLYAAVTARKALGLDPGPELPPIEEPRGDQLTQAQQVTVQGQSYQGYPDYTPGAPYYYGGGRGVPGGWYATPFWETLLIGSVLTGGFGGGWGGGGYGAGYDTGFDAGRDSAQDSGAGGDWGGGGGGGTDWGGGSDWGGGGGGDWGGGGGDWGGGGGGDGGW